MKSFFRIGIFCLALGALAMSSWGTVGHLQNTVKAPDFTVKDLDGKNRSLSEFEGKTVLLMFWATWCGPCRMEIPHMNALQKEYKDKNFVVLGLALDQKGSQHVKNFTKRTKITYPVWMADSDLASKYGGISSIPTAFLVDHEGFVRAKFIGMHKTAVFEQEINKILP